MLSLVGKDEILRNVYRVARLFDPDGDLTNYESLRDAFLSQLAEKNPHMPINYSWDPFIRDPRVEEQLAKAFDVDAALNDLNQDSVVGDTYSDTARERRLARAEDALRDLLVLNEDLNLVFGLVVHSIFCKESTPKGGRQSAHGGSSSGMIGSTWLSLDDSVTKSDIMEVFVHELTHVLLFVDELNHEQFDYTEIVKPENFALSAILLKRRPLDKSIHSIVVATELLFARRDFLGEADDLTIHPPSQELAKNTVVAADSVLALPRVNEMTSERLLGFVRMCCEHCQSFLPAREMSA
jgi:hypothetical protein